MYQVRGGKRIHPSSDPARSPGASFSTSPLATKLRSLPRRVSQRTVVIFVAGVILAGLATHLLPQLRVTANSDDVSDGASLGSQEDIGEAGSAQRQLEAFESGSAADLPQPKSSSCRRSNAESGGMFCMPDEVWNLVLLSEANMWARVNASVHPERGGKKKSQILRARPDEPQIDYQIRYLGRLHTTMRKMYLQSVWFPTLSCPEGERVGSLDAHALWVCGLRALAVAGKAGNCLVYSFGCNPKLGFERELARSAKGCEIRAYDKELSERWSIPKNSSITVERLELATEKKSGDEAKSFEQIVEKNGHAERTINLLKLNLGGDEFEVLPEILHAPPSLLPRQIILTLNMKDQPWSMIREADELLLGLRDAGYAMTNAETDIESPLNIHRFTFIRLDAALK